MLQTTQGIVFHAFKYKDAGMITRIYTRDHGILSFLINNAYGKKSIVTAALLQPLTILNIEMYFKPRRNFQRFKEVSVCIPFQTLNTDIFKSSISMFIAEILKKSIKEEETNCELFDFLTHSLTLFDSLETNSNNFHVMFLCKLAGYLGFAPANNYSPANCYFNIREGQFTPFRYDEAECLSATLSTQLHAMLSNNYGILPELHLTSNERKTLLDALVCFYAVHVEGTGKINSYKILQEVYG